MKHLIFLKPPRKGGKKRICPLCNKPATGREIHLCSAIDKDPLQADMPSWVYGWTPANQVRSGPFARSFIQVVKLA